ncbi:Chromodomain-helicase-DNA-binding protein 1-like [Liparis tanakae]|uniref:Chromodomain-helicase-DNA-binding protein 1-like n=1 Tax=Liparis tanakae TaxID=230148 RepID=A0A4Z2ETK1_9TELE|nr:Chromodomain-helicase-DNA-binding protein 1-like [Liparis tanakae]
MAWWESCGYRSRCLPPVDSEEEEEEEEEEDDGSVCSSDSDGGAIRYVLGDVTHPHAAMGDAIIVHCVDDSGRWGRGGLFTALETRSDQPRDQYELAGKMKDLEVGSVLLLSIDDKQSRLDGRDQLALIVAQRRDEHNTLSGILLTALDDGLKKIHAAAKRHKASVHLPRIGHATPGFNWYGTERLIRKHLASRGVDTFIYYHNRAAKNSAPPSPTATTSLAPPPQTSSSSDGPTDDEAPGPSAPPPTSSSEAPPPTSSSEAPPPTSSSEAPPPTLLPSFMGGVCRRGTYDGDEDDVMSAEVTHVVAEVESSVQSQDLQALLARFPQAVPVQSAWLESCFSRQRMVSPAPFLLP